MSQPPRAERASASGPRYAGAVTSRRTLLTGLGAAGLAAVGGTALVRGCTAPVRVPTGGAADAPCVPRSSLSPQTRIGDAALVYEEDRRPRSFAFDAGFHAQLGRWLADWRGLQGPLAPVTAIDTFGAWTDGGTACNSWHNAGRAFDIARLRGGGDTLVSCRQDLWAELPAAERDAYRRAYWRLAAHLYARFAYVLTYLFDDLHRNHIHVDNGVSGDGAPGFETSSRVQIQAVQASCTYVWGVDCPLSGTWDAATRRASRAVLERVGASGDLTRGDNWARFMNATAAHG